VYQKYTKLKLYLLYVFIALEDLVLPTLTEVTPGKFIVKFGERELTPLNTHEDDCGFISYPANGDNYENNEDIVILVNPQTPGLRDIVFTNFNTESGYDVVRVFVWEDNQFVLART